MDRAPDTWQREDNIDTPKSTEAWHVNSSIEHPVRGRAPRAPSFMSPPTCLSLYLVFWQNRRLSILQHHPPYDPWARLAPSLIWTGKKGHSRGGFPAHECLIILTKLSCPSFTEDKTFLSISIIWRLTCNHGAEESYEDTATMLAEPLLNSNRNGEMWNIRLVVPEIHGHYWGQSNATVF